MRNARAAALVGLVVILGAAAFVASYSVARKRFSTDDGAMAVYALFDDGSGLGPGSRVTIAGVPVGEVTAVGIAPEDPSLARVDFLVRNDVVLRAGVKEGERLEGAAIVSKKAASLLGDQYLELTAGSHGPKIGHGEKIPHAISATGISAIMKEMEKSSSLIARVDGIFERLDTIAEDVKAVTASVRSVVGTVEGAARIDRITKNIENASRDIADVVGEVKGIAGDVRGFMGESVLGRGEQLNHIILNVERFTERAASLAEGASGSASRILDNVEVVTRDVRALISGSKGEVESSLGSIRGALRSFTRALETLEDTIDTVRSIATKIDRGEGSLGKLVNDSGVVDKVEGVVAKVDEVVSDAGDLVKRVTRMETRVELESQYNFEAEAFKNYVRLRFQPREDKYYLLELVDDPGGKSETVSRTIQKDDGLGAVETTEVVTENRNELRVSLQFAKRWLWFTGRFGLMESTGGIGLDAEFLEDALKVTVDLFDFDDAVAPRMRILASWSFYEHFAVMGGVDRVLDTDRMDYFVGIGLRFTDADLKALLTVAPTPSL